LQEMFYITPPIKPYSISQMANTT